MNDFLYRMRVLLAINLIAVISVATTHYAMEQGLFTRLMIWTGWLVVIQAIGLLFVADRRIAQVFPDHLDDMLELNLRRAERGDRIATFQVGRSYEEGTGVNMDLTEAKRWYRRAAAQDLDEATAALRRLEEAA